MSNQIILPIVSVGENTYSDVISLPTFFSGEAIPSTLTVNTSGGVIIGGVAPYEFVPFVASGGVIVGGEAISPNTYNVLTNGGVLISGSADSIAITSELGNGGVVISGSVINTLSYNVASDGGVVISGSAEIEFPEPVAFDMSVGFTIEIRGTIAQDFAVEIPSMLIEMEGEVIRQGGIDTSIASLEWAFEEQTIKINTRAATVASEFSATRGAGAYLFTIPEVNLIGDFNGVVGHIGSIESDLGDFAFEGYAARGRLAAIDTQMGCKFDCALTGVVGVAGNFNTGITLDLDVRLVRSISATIDTGFSLYSVAIVDHGQTIPAQKVITINLSTGAITEYDWLFNSYCTVGDKTYAASADGLFLIGGQSDNGLPINTNLKWGKFDSFSAKMKRANDVWVGAQVAGQMEWVTYTDTATYNYPLDNPDTNLTTHKAHLGRGIKSRWWQFGLRNINGADFHLYDALINVDGGARK